MGFDTAYEAITEENDDHRWAYGTGFDDPMAGVDTTVPAGVDASDLAGYCLMLGDDALVMSHRLQEWLTRAPELEEETAIANIGLDLLGQARRLLARAGAAEGAGRTEDDLAYRRDEPEFRNVRLVESIDADFGGLIARLFLFSTWRLAVFARLRDSHDPVLAAIADQAVKELAYHRDYAAQWLIRLGDGTAYSHDRAADGLAAVAPLVGELFRDSGEEQRLGALGVAVSPDEVRGEFRDVCAQVLDEATLTWPDAADRTGVAGRYGRDGIHTEAMGRLLAELQSVARAHPGATW